MTEEDRTWQVTRFCCTSGMCIDCRRVAPGAGMNPNRTVVVQADRLTEAKAKEMAQNWRNYAAKAERMP